MLNLVTVTVPVKHEDVIHPVQVVGELVRPGLAITPSLRRNGFTGGFKLTHIASGHAINGSQACMGCVRTFVSTMPDFDWDRPAEEITGSEAAKEINLAMQRAFVRCDGGVCDFDREG